MTDEQLGRACHEAQCGCDSGHNRGGAHRMTEEEAALWAAIGEMPEDELRRQVAADWHEERPGEVACERCRGKGDWTSYKGPGTTGGIRFVKCPTCHGTGRVSNGNPEMAEALRATADRVPIGNGGTQSDPPFGWYGGTVVSGIHPESDLPRDVFDLLEGEDWDMRNFRMYPTATAAIRDLCRAWVKVHKGRR